MKADVIVRGIRAVSDFEYELLCSHRKAPDLPLQKKRLIRRISTLSFRKSKEKNITKVEEQTKLWQQQFTREVLTRLL